MTSTAAVLTNVHGENLTDISWAHAVNNAEYLTEVLKGEINYIEADISLGYLQNDTEKLCKIPIMAHPPATESNLSLKEFLQRVFLFNSKAENSKVKGIKLDFKSIEALEKSVEIVQQYYSITKYPTWINADILSGPVENTNTIPVNPERFFKSAKKLGPVVLSIGWTTRWGNDVQEGSYSDDNIEQMINTIITNQIDKQGCTITFPIRAGIAANSMKSLTQLYSALESSNLISFTIWSSENDPVDVEKLRNFIFSFGLDKIYIDVPKKLKEQLRLKEFSAQPDQK